MPNENETLYPALIMDALKTVRYPGTGRNIVEMNMVEDDPRITAVGRILRKTSLDEFPQFVNVLKGEMSVVGPRPIVDEELAHYGDDLDEFLSCKPGVTGWWQVQARNDATYADGSRQQLELYYARHASATLDLNIVLRTFSAVFDGTGK